MPAPGAGLRRHGPPGQTPPPPWPPRAPPAIAWPMAADEMQGELERLRAENERMRRTANRGITMKVSEKGGLSVYGLGRFPVTLYKEQWLKLLDMSDDIRAFIAANQGTLKAKEDGKPAAADA